MLWVRKRRRGGTFGQINTVYGFLSDRCFAARVAGSPTTLVHIEGICQETKQDCTSVLEADLDAVVWVEKPALAVSCEVSEMSILSIFWIILTANPVVVALNLNVRASAADSGGLPCIVSFSLFKEASEFVSETRALFQLHSQKVCQIPFCAIIVWIHNDSVGGFTSISGKVSFEPIDQFLTSPSGNGSRKGHGQISVVDHRFPLIGHSMDWSLSRRSVSRIGVQSAGYDSSRPVSLQSTK